jgi:hypothetical protein
MPSADFCIAFRRLLARAVQFGSKDPQGTRCRPPEVSSIAFRTLPPEFTSDGLDGYGLRGNLPARPPPAASYPVLVHWLVRLLALPSDPVSRRQPLRFAILHLHQVGARTFTSPAIEHARHTGCARCARRLTPSLTDACAAAARAIRREQQAPVNTRRRRTRPRWYPPSGKGSDHNQHRVQRHRPWPSPYSKQSVYPGGWPNIIYGVGQAAPTARDERAHPPGIASSKKGR